MELAEGFEPPTLGLQIRCSTNGATPAWWSGRRESDPRPTAWKAVTLPLSYSRGEIHYIRRPDFGPPVPPIPPTAPRPRSAAGHTSTEYPHLPHFQSPAASVATVNHRPPAILMLSWRSEEPIRSLLLPRPERLRLASHLHSTNELHTGPIVFFRTPPAATNPNTRRRTPPPMASNVLIPNALLEIGFVRSKSSHAEIHPHPIRLFSFPQLASAPAIHISLVRSRNCRPLRSDCTNPPPSPVPIAWSPLIPHALSKIGFVRSKMNSAPKSELRAQNSTSPHNPQPITHKPSPQPPTSAAH